MKNWWTQEEIVTLLAQYENLVSDLNYEEPFTLYSKVPVDTHTTIDLVFFAYKPKTREPVIGIIEAKVTATVDNVAQILRKKNRLEIYLGDVFEKDKSNKPQFEFVLAGRYIDHKILDICRALNIKLYQINFNNDGIASTEMIIQNYQKPVEDFPALTNAVLDFFGDKKVKKK